MTLSRPPLFAFWMVLACCGSIAQAETAAETAAKLEQLKGQISALERQIDAQLGDRESLQRQLRANDREIAEISIRQKDLELRIQALETDAGVLEQRRDELRGQIDRAAHDLVRVLHEQYRQGQTPRLQLLLSDQDPEKLNRMLRYYQHLSQRLKDRVDQFEQQLSDYQSTNLQLAETQQEIASEQMQLDLQRRELDASRIRRLKTLAQIENTIEQKRGRIEELNANVARLQSVLEEINRSLDLASLQESSGRFAERKGALAWPLEGPVVQAFGSELSKDGVVIGAEPGNTVFAVHPGRVVFSEWLRGYGLLLILDHGQGYMTLYGQNQGLLRQTGDWVSAGDAIAISGSSGGATQPGLYFSIRHKAQSTNPLNWLKSRG